MKKLNDVIRKIKSPEDVNALGRESIIVEFKTGNLYHYEEFGGESTWIKRGKLPTTTIKVPKSRIQPEVNGTFSFVGNHYDIGEMSSGDFTHTDSFALWRNIGRTK